MPAPANDDFANRITLTGSSGTWSGTNVGATSEVGEPESFPYSGGDAGVWFQWTCPSSGRYQWDAFSVTDTVDTLLNIFQGSTLAGLSLVAGSDDSFITPPPGAFYRQSCIRTDFVGGNIYVVRLDGYDRGPITLNWGPAAAIPGTPPTPPSGEIQLLDGFTWDGAYEGRWIVNISPLPSPPGDGGVSEYDVSVPRPTSGVAAFYIEGDTNAFYGYSVPLTLFVDALAAGLVFDSADPPWWIVSWGGWHGTPPTSAQTWDGIYSGPYDLGFSFVVDTAHSDPNWDQPPPPPVITSTTPEPANVGDTLTIIGEHFNHVIGPIYFNIGSGYGGTPASAYNYPTIVSDTEITVEVPVGAVTGDIQASSVTGNAFWGVRINGTFGISSWLPAPAVSGERVDVVGTQFTGITDVTWGFPFATPIAQTFVIDDDDHLHFAMNPVGSDYTTGLIGVTNPSAVSPSVSPFYPHQFLDVLRSPIIYTLSTDIGAPGDIVDVTSGDYFLRMVSVEFVDILTAARYSAAFTVIDRYTMTITVPTVPLARSYYIEATNAAGTDTNHYTGGFYVHAPAPTITSFSPAFGIAGTVVTIVGAHLANVVEVDFNGTASIDVTIIDDAHLTAVAPVGTTTGPIAVTDPVPQTATSATNFTIVQPPTITGFGPVFVSVGDTVTVTGTNFTYVTAVTLTGMTASFVVVNDTTLTFVVPHTTSGTIVVTNPAGSATSAAELAVVSSVGTTAVARVHKMGRRNAR